MNPATLMRLMERPPLSDRLRLGPEDRIGIAFANDLRVWTIEGRLRAVWTHVGNEIGGGTKNAKIRYAIARALGMITGTADYLFMWDSGAGGIELKAGRGRQTDRQSDFEAWCLARGVAYRVVRSAEEGREVLVEWGVLS